MGCWVVNYFRIHSVLLLVSLLKPRGGVAMKCVPIATIPQEMNVYTVCKAEIAGPIMIFMSLEAYGGRYQLHTPHHNHIQCGTFIFGAILGECSATGPLLLGVQSTCDPSVEVP
jgi:hypothetical protein